MFNSKRAFLWMVILVATARSGYAACGTAPTKLFFSTTKSTVTGLTTAGTLVTSSGTEAAATGGKTAKTTLTWFEMKEGTANSASVAGDSSTANALGWNNDAASINAGCSIPSGTWTVSSSMSDSSGSQTSAVLSAHVYTCSGSTCTNKCNFTNSAVSMSTTATTITASSTCGQINFTSGIDLYLEVYYESGSTNSSTSTSATTTFRELGTNDFVSFPQDITTPAPSCGGSSAIALLGVGCR